MNDQPNIGHPDPSPRRDPAQDAATVSQTQIIAPNVLPDLSVADGTSTVGRNKAAEPPKLDGYDVITSIGEGGMGTVWRAVQLSTRRNVALKLISAAGFGSERARQRFDREVEITARLEHPNIARVYDSGINRGVYFYAMELIDGVPLDQYVSRHRLNRTDILGLFAIVCHAVDHAHQRGVIHRDLKPGNILVTPDGQPHVLDFGLAKALEQAGKEAGISIDGEIAGTPGYMSPEQAAGKLDIDARCDVYSLGVILYRLLTGQSPHDLSGTYLDILRRVSDEEPKRPRTADRTIDRELEALLLRALQRDPSHRYKTAGELAQDVENYLHGDPLTAKPPTLAYFAGKRVRKHRVKIAVTAIVFVLAGLAILQAVRLIRAHRDQIQDARNSEIQKQLTLQKAHDLDVARGINLIADGNAAMTSAHWTDARTFYRSARDLLARTGVSTIRADLGLWNLERTFPSPLSTFGKLPKTASADAPNAGALLIFPDNRRALAGYDDGSIRIFDMATGQVLKTISAGRGAVRSIAASADSKLVLVGGDAGSLKLWDLGSGTLRTDFQDTAAPLKNWVTHVAFSPDGRYALSVSGATAELLTAPNYNDTLTLWDVVSGQVVLRTNRDATVFDANQTITAAAFSSDSSMVLTAGAQVVVWSARDGKRIAAMPLSATAASFSEDGGDVVAGSSDGTIHFLNVATGKTEEMPRLENYAGKNFLTEDHGRAIEAIQMASGSGDLVAITEDGVFCDGSSDGFLYWSQPPKGDFDAITLSADASLALTAGESGLSVWRIARPPEMHDLARGRRRHFPAVTISGDGRLILVRPRTMDARRETAWFEDAATETALGGGSNLDFEMPASGIVMSRDGRSIARLWPSVAVCSLDPPYEKQQLRAEHVGGLIAISNDGTKLAVGANDNSLAIYLRSGKIGPKLIVGTAPVTSATFSSDGRMLLVGSEDQSAHLWNTDTSELIAVLRGHTAPVNAVAISDDGRLAVTGSGSGSFQSGDDNSVRIWDIPTGKQLSILKGHSARVNAVAISGDGQLVVSGSDDSTVTLWDRATGDPLQTVRTAGPVSSLSIDHGGHTLVCGGDAELSLWKLNRPSERRELESAVASVLSKDASSPPPAADDLTLGRWYAFQGQSAWAYSFFQQAEAGGIKVPLIEKWRVEWESGDLVAAERDVKLLPAQDAPPYYVNLCAAAIRAEKSRKPLHTRYFHLFGMTFGEAWEE